MCICVYLYIYIYNIQICKNVCIYLQKQILKNIFIKFNVSLKTSHSIYTLNLNDLNVIFFNFDYISPMFNYRT